MVHASMPSRFLRIPILAMTSALLATGFGACAPGAEDSMTDAENRPQGSLYRDQAETSAPLRRQIDPASLRNMAELLAGLGPDATCLAIVALRAQAS